MAGLPLRYASGLTVLGVAWLALASGCGDDKKADKEKPLATDAGGDDAVDSGTADDAGEVPTCADDVAMTPGIECKAFVACGGTLAEPQVCPRATHTCCVSGVPSKDTVNCHLGTSACTGSETVTPCDGPEDCGNGQVCCVSPISAQVTTECRAPDKCDDASEGIMFCHTDADCPGGKTCVPPTFASWWGFCS